MLIIVLLSVAVGLFIGVVGVGGVLLIPGLQYSAGLDIHAASATALFSFIFCGVLGTFLFERRGSINWRLSLPMCVGGLVFSFLGAWASSFVNSTTLVTVVALVIVLSGVTALLKPREEINSKLTMPDISWLALFGIGALCGFGSGLSGAGGAVFLIPLLLLIGFPLLPAIGSAQIFQLASAISGSIANLLSGTVNFEVAIVTVVPLLVGVSVGVYLAHKMASTNLQRLAATLCVVVGVMLWVH